MITIAASRGCNNASKRFLTIALFAGLLSTEPSVSAQNASPAQDAASGEVVRLSPFTVNADEDEGYRVINDTTGSRLATDIRDVPVPITVFTQAMMEDLNITNVQEAMDYAPNVEFTEFTAGIADISTLKMNIRGFRNAGRGGTQDFFATFDDLDAYKLDRIGFSMGPNSLLFGIGFPGGQVTSTAKQATPSKKNAYELTTRVDSWGGWRAFFDVQQTLIADRLALRAVILKQDRREGIKDTFQKDERVFLTTTAVLSDRQHFRTTLRANYEWVEGEDAVSLVILPQDGISQWLAAGRPTGTVAAPPAGTENQSTTPKLVYVGGASPDLPIMNWRNTLQTMTATPPIPAMVEAIYPYDINLKGDGNVAPREFENWNVFLEQQLGRDFYVEAAFSHSYDFRRHLLKSGGNQLRADPNPLLPNGQANPNVGKLYVESAGGTDDREQWRDTFRLTASYEFDFDDVNPSVGNWLGSHRLMGAYEDETYEMAWSRKTVVNTTPLPGAPTQLNNSQNRVNVRSYLDFENGVRSFEPDIRALEARDGVTPRAMPIGGQDRNQTDVISTIFALQSNFWNDRIMTTFGWRTDKQDLYSGKGEALRDPVTGLLPDAADQSIDPASRASAKFKPTSRGIVVRPLPWFSLYYNTSKNFISGEPTQVTLFGDRLPARGGNGEDYGIRFELMENRLSVGINAYETSGVNAIVNSIGAGTMDDIWESIGRMDMILPGNTRDTQDETSKGIELTTHFNPTPNWRLYFSLTKNETELTNLYPNHKAYMAQHLATWQASASTPVAGAQGTVGDLIENLVTATDNALAQEGNTPYNMRKWNASMSTNYRFTQGFLRNASVGGAVLYRGDAISGYPIIDGIPQYGQPMEESDYYIVNFNLGYDFKLKNRTELRTRLTIENALDRDGRVIVTSRNTTAGANRTLIGTPATARWIEGTSVVLTTTLAF